MAILGSGNLSGYTSFSRAVVGGYSGSGDAVAFQREAAVDVLRSSHVIDGVACALLEAEPVTPCLLAAPLVAATGGVISFTATVTLSPGDADHLEWRLDGAGVWTATASGEISAIAGAAGGGDHVLNVRGVTLGGAIGATGTSASFTVTGVLPVSVSDDFNRADANPLSDGTQITYLTSVGVLAAMRIVANELRPADFGGTPWACRMQTPTFAANQSCAVIIGSVFESYAGIGPCARMGTDGSGYYLSATSSSFFQPSKITVDPGTGAITQTALDTVNVGVMVPGDEVEITVETVSGNAVIKSYLNGALKSTVTDSSSPYLTGQPGIMAFSNYNSATLNAVAAADL